MNDDEDDPFGGGPPYATPPPRPLRLGCIVLLGAAAALSVLAGLATVPPLLVLGPPRPSVKELAQLPETRLSYPGSRLDSVEADEPVRIGFVLRHAAIHRVDVSTASRAELVGFYDRRLRAAGWSGAVSGPDGARAWTRAGRTFRLGFLTGEDALRVINRQDAATADTVYERTVS